MTTEEKIAMLQSFCSTDSSRPRLHSPFTQGEHTYATDGSVLIRIPAIAEIGPRDDAPAGAAGSLFIDAAEDFAKGEFKALPSVDVVACRFCEGAGKIKQVRCGHCGNWTKIPVECPYESCDGKGNAPANSNGVLFGTQMINPYYVWKLSGLPGIVIANASKSWADPLAFKFDGGEGLLMPMRTKS